MQWVEVWERGSRPKMGWTLKVSEYGKIESAEIETAPLTLFVGDNNSGKSYLMSLLWGVRNLGPELLYGERSGPATEAEDRLLCWVKEQGKVSLIFGLEIMGGKSVIFTRMGSNGVGQFFFGYEQASGELEDSFYWRLIVIIFDLLLNEGDGIHWKGNGSIYLPAARTGFMLTKDIINKAGREAAFNIGLETETYTPFVRPINQFLDVINDLTLDGEGSENFAEVVKYLESGMADGIVEMSSMPNKEVTYIPNGKAVGMSLRTVSAVVTELSPLILILKHKKRVDALFYEEPEMCLHPQLQQKMSRVLCQLVNAGVQMNVTTHSDIILQHINNMLCLSARQDREEICRQLGYMDDDLLCPGKVKVYQLTASAGAKTKVEELSCGKNGFAVPTFNDALDRIMDEAYVIQE